jgi:hypothetical protein
MKTDRTSFFFYLKKKKEKPETSNFKQSTDSALLQACSYWLAN